MRNRIVQAATVAIAASLLSATHAASPKAKDSAEETELEAVASLLEATGDAQGVETVEEAEAPGLWKPHTTYAPTLGDFIAEAGALQERDRPGRRRIAAKYGLSDRAFEEAVQMLRDMQKYQYRDEKKGALRARALRLVTTADRAPVALMIAGSVLDNVAENGCGRDDVDLLMSGSRDSEADLWAVAASCVSSEALAAALESSVKARPALSFVALNWTGNDPDAELAAADMLLGRGFLDQVEEAARDRVHATAARYKLTKLLRIGLLEDALQFGDSLPPPILRMALSPDKEELRTTIGGLQVRVSPYSDPSPADYAGALALAGRADEARTILDLGIPAAKRRDARACLDAGRDDCKVGQYDGIPVASLIVDQLLDRPDRDPYVLVERDSLDHGSGGGGVVEAMCRLLSKPGEQEDCEAGRKMIASRRSEKGEGQKDDRAFWAAVAHAGRRPFEEARSRYAARIASFGTEASESYRRRVSVDPAPTQFRELPLPGEIASLAARKSADPKGFAALPEGYHAVRIERSGRRAAAVSLSQRFDPNGEVTAGGYWLHLSEDGGKSWQAPLYTGLAEYFPYVVPERYRMPLLAGDRIQLEVEEALIDTASIFYPPVGTRIRRKREGIYLDIPVADLARDSDDDGLSDIAVRHLLLDQVSPGGTPYVVGRGTQCSPPSETAARLEILKRLFSVETQAAIEPVSPRKEIIEGWRRSSPTEKPPILLEGNPDDYRCVTLDRPMIVYAEGDRERLRKFSPDFQLIRLPSIRWNRDHSRGFVQWSMGWTGGTYRLVREGEGWKLESIQEWIT